MRTVLLALIATAGLAPALACRAVVAVPAPAVVRVRPAPGVVVVARPAPVRVVHRP